MRTPTMYSPLFSRPMHRAMGAAALLLAAGCAAPSAMAPATPMPNSEAPATGSLQSLDYSGSQASLEALDHAIAEAATDAKKISAILADLTNVLKQPAVTEAARQAICQRLGQILVATDDGIAARDTLAPLLRDERHVNVARLALEPIPGAAVDTLFLRALNETTTTTRLALVQSVGNRHMVEAIPALTRLLKEPNTPTAAAAAKALGQIGTSAGLAALLGAPDPEARDVVEARLACAWSLPAPEGNAAFRAIFDDPRLVVVQRAAALRGLVEREPATAGQRIGDVLAGDEEEFKRVAIEGITPHTAPGLVAALAVKLNTWDAPTQAAVITAFGRKGDVAAVPVVLANLAAEDPGIRAAAIAALGLLPGNPEVAAQLARVAASGPLDEAKLARQSLARLNGPEIQSTILAGAERGDAPLRAAFIEETGLRNMTEALPLLLKTRADPDVTARSAALGALAMIAPPTEQEAILAWAIAASDGQETTRALQALVSVTQRNRDAATRDHAVVDAIDHGTAAAQLRLLPVLSRLASAATGGCAGRLALSSDETVAAAATAALARWPDDSILPLLAAVAEKSTHDPVRAAAVQGAMRLLDRGRTLPLAEQSSLVALLLGTTNDAEVRKNLTRTLGCGASDFALKYAESLRTDPSLADEARDAALAIRANQEWPPVLTASANAGQLTNLIDGKPNTFWTVPATAKQWLQVDFKRTRPIHRLALDQGTRAGDYPERYEVYVTDDPTVPGEVRAKGAGRRDKTVIELPAGTSGRYVIIKHTEVRKEANWAIAELQVD